MWQNSIRLQTMNLSNPPFTRHEISVVDLLQSCPRHFPGAALFGAEHVLSFLVFKPVGKLAFTDRRFSPVCSVLAADWHAQTAGCSGEQELLARPMFLANTGCVCSMVQGS